MLFPARYCYEKSNQFPGEAKENPESAQLQCLIFAYGHADFQSWVLLPEILFVEHELCCHESLADSDIRRQGHYRRRHEHL
jgi:hypothetical protein